MNVRDALLGLSLLSVIYGVTSESFSFQGQSVFYGAVLTSCQCKKNTFFFFNVAHCIKNISYSAVWFKSTYFGEESMLSVMNDIMMYFFLQAFSLQLKSFYQKTAKAINSVKLLR